MARIAHRARIAVIAGRVIRYLRPHAQPTGAGVPSRARVAIVAGRRIGYRLAHTDTGRANIINRANVVIGTRQAILLIGTTVDGLCQSKEVAGVLWLSRTGRKNDRHRRRYNQRPTRTPRQGVCKHLNHH